MSVIKIKNLTVAYDSKPVLQNVSLTIEENSVTAIVGPNGAGKSTLLKSMLGFMPRLTGEVSIFQESVEKVLAKIAYVPQRSSVNWDFPITVSDVVLMGRYGKLGFFHRPSKKDKEIAYQALREMDLYDLRDRQISNLSGGQKQRVFIARALCQNADLLIMDEPLAGVDKVSEKIIMDKVKILQKEGKTIICVHHELATIPQYFDHVVFVNNVIIDSGKTEDVFHEKNLQKTYNEVFHV